MVTIVNALRQAALDYHALPEPGKIGTATTKPLTNARELALAYSPGVAAPCEAIAANPLDAFRYTGRGNLVAVITNGTAVLGLGAIGALAAKPVMEGKAALFKKFAGIDVFDLEIDETDPERLVQVIAALEPTFGGINLEDIKAPECFEIERQLRAKMRIPVFHDDQHGTAVVVAAAFINGLHLVRKRIESVKLVVSGAGAAAIACAELLIRLGLPRANVWLTDTAGLVYEGRAQRMDPMKSRFAQPTHQRTLRETMQGADVFLGLSCAGVLQEDMVASMAPNPLILALANPIPEMMPEVIRQVRNDAIVATGRSDYPNQVNNVLCFPYIFRGALDVGATAITPSMEIAVVDAIAALAREAHDPMFGGTARYSPPVFGPDYLIPTPFDPRLMPRIAPAVARAAIADGVASRPIDLDGYVRKLIRWAQPDKSAA
jgi:malate dehydrogenase (oxaloacetate-decarboxylating)(NADP+)